jgi:hypothetical protein
MPRCVNLLTLEDFLPFEGIFRSRLQRFGPHLTGRTRAAPS